MVIHKKPEHAEDSNNKKLKNYYASGMALIEGRWQSCGWMIEASSFVEAAKIAEEDEKFRIHSLSDNIVY